MILLKRYDHSGFLRFNDISNLSKYCNCSKSTAQNLLNDSVSLGVAKICKTGYAIIGFKKLIQKFYINDIRIFDKSGNLKSLTDKVMESIAINKLSQQSFMRKKALLDQSRGSKNKHVLNAKIKDRAFGFECRTSARVMAKTLGCSHVIANRVLNSIEKKGLAVFIDFGKDLAKNASFLCFVKTGYFFAKRFLLEINKIEVDELIGYKTPLIM